LDGAFEQLPVDFWQQWRASMHMFAVVRAIQPLSHHVYASSACDTRERNGTGRAHRASTVNVMSMMLAPSRVYATPPASTSALHAQQREITQSHHSSIKFVSSLELTRYSQHAGVVTAAAELLDATQIETSVRCLMVLGMLLPHNPPAQQQLAANPAALYQLLKLLKQQEDMDAKVISRDLVRILMQDEGLKGQVEAAIRQASSEEAAEQGQCAEKAQEAAA
jgi:hypothetical protein